MKTSSPSVNALRVGLIATLFGLSSFAHAGLVKESFNVANGGTLDLRTDIGSIDIRTHDADTIELEVDVRGKRQDEFELTYNVSGSSLKVLGELENRSYWGNDIRVEFVIKVPEKYSLDLQTAGGSISISDLEGNIDAKTSGGSINIGDVKGDVELHTSGGSINTEDIYGEIDAHTSGGSVNVRFAKQFQQNASLSTSGGSITAYLPSDIAIDIDASTSGGQVRSDFDVDGSVKKRSIRGAINGGGPELKLRTSGGSVRIKER